jgi:hypothetical protein
VGCVAATDLNLPLACHVPDLYMLAKVPVILLDRRAIGFWQEHMVDDAETAHTMRFDAVCIRCTPYPA